MVALLWIMNNNVKFDWLEINLVNEREREFGKITQNSFKLTLTRKTTPRSWNRDLNGFHIETHVFLLLAAKVLMLLLLLLLLLRIGITVAGRRCPRAVWSPKWMENQQGKVRERAGKLKDEVWRWQRWWWRRCRDRRLREARRGALSMLLLPRKIIHVMLLLRCGGGRWAGTCER